MLPLVTSALIAGGASVLGSTINSIFGSNNQSSANATNIQLNRETNANNLKIANETNQSNQSIANAYNLNQLKLADIQNDWNLSQWNRENAYNSPSAQRQRLEEAGLNPYFFGIDGNTASTGLQAVTPDQTYIPNELGAPQTSAQVSPFQPNIDFGSAGQYISDSIYKNNVLKLQAEKQSEEIANMHADKMLKDLQIARENGTLDDFFTRYKYETKQTKADYYKTLAETKQLRRSIQGLELDNQVKRVLVKYADDEHRTQLAESLMRTQQIAETIKVYEAQVKLTNAQSNLTNAQIVTEGYKQQNIASQTASTNIDNDTKRETQQAEIIKQNAVNEVISTFANNGLTLGASDAENLLGMLLKKDPASARKVAFFLSSLGVGTNVVNNISSQLNTITGGDKAQDLLKILLK